MPRLFVALDLPASVKKSLEPLGKGLGDVRWLLPEQQHLTLRFIGDVDHGAMHDVAEALATVPARPFRRCRRLTFRCAASRARSGSGRQSAELAGLKRRIDRALREAAVPAETRKLRPTSPSRAYGRRCRPPGSAPT